MIIKYLQSCLAALDWAGLTESSRSSFQNILHQTITKMAAKPDKHVDRPKVYSRTIHKMDKSNDNLL